MNENLTNETKKCKHCQSDIPKKAKVCPVCRKRQGHPVLGTVLLIIGILMFLSGACGSSDKGQPTKVANSSSETVTVDTSEPTVSTSETFGVGDTAEYNGVRVTLNSITESNGSQFNKPADGNVFLLVNFTIENNTDSDLAISSLMSFDAYQDGYNTNLSLSALVEKSGEQLDGSIAPGKKMQGSVGYEVPSSYSEFEINYQSDVWDNTKFTFIYKK